MIASPLYHAQDAPFQIWNEDCVAGMVERLGPESVHLCITSIPFGALFQYSAKTEDIGNCQDGIDMRSSMFGAHLRFFAEQLKQVLLPGRNACIHIQQLLAYKVQHGYMGRRDFRGAVIDIFTAAGFEWAGEVSIPKNPQVIAQRLKLHSLQFMTGHSRDACALAPAVNDFVLFFRKPGENPAPVRCIYDRETNPSGWLTQEDWILWARGTWDIQETDVLENFTRGRDEKDEKHVCPLQLEVIRRPVLLYTHPGETVLDPFMGIGSSAYVSIEHNRRAVGFELKESYHRIAVENCSRALTKEQMSLPMGDEE
ncbi:site-specific DNA-methyltransferase [Candidatus Parcubacteria bacterium]|nr:site-specific DNA-methyltransferase [Candidatus Parcubacteria bacterium]